MINTTQRSYRWEHLISLSSFESASARFAFLGLLLSRRTKKWLCNGSPDREPGGDKKAAFTCFQPVGQWPNGLGHHEVSSYSCWVLRGWATWRPSRTIWAPMWPATSSTPSAPYRSALVYFPYLLAAMGAWSRTALTGLDSGQRRWTWVSKERSEGAFDPRECWIVCSKHFLMNFK